MGCGAYAALLALAAISAENEQEANDGQPFLHHSPLHIAHAESPSFVGDGAVMHFTCHMHAKVEVGIYLLAAAAAAPMREYLLGSCCGAAKGTLASSGCCFKSFESMGAPTASAVCNPEPDAGAPVRDANATLLTVAALRFLGCAALTGESTSSRARSIATVIRGACDQEGLKARCTARGAATTQRYRQATLQAVISGRVPASFKQTLFCNFGQLVVLTESLKRGLRKLRSQ